jgi:hypothetical protein
MIEMQVVLTNHFFADAANLTTKNLPWSRIRNRTFCCFKIVTLAYIFMFKTGQSTWTTKLALWLNSHKTVWSKSPTDCLQLTWSTMMSHGTGVEKSALADVVERSTRNKRGHTTSSVYYTVYVHTCTGRRLSVFISCKAGQNNSMTSNKTNQCGRYKLTNPPWQSFRSYTIVKPDWTRNWVSDR